MQHTLTVGRRSVYRTAGVAGLGFDALISRVNNGVKSNPFLSVVGQRTMKGSPMIKSNTLNFTVAAIAGCALIATTPAYAGACPADQVGENPLANAPSKPVGETDTVLGAIDLADVDPKFDGRKFRLRRLTVAPGGVVPKHSHAERVALIYVVSGEINEYNSKCKTPITHRAGELAEESIGVEHWWKNESDEAVTLISADILPPR